MTIRQTVQLLSLAALVMTVGCNRQDMRDQSRFEPLEASAFFDDGLASRQFVEHTIARGHLRTNTHLYAGTVEGEPAETLPMPLTRAMLDRGQERYQIYCSPCHDNVGTGQGMVVQRGFKQPRSFHDLELRGKPVGYYYDAITRGFGAMPDYASQIKVEDRWAIVAYIKALQFSQGAEFSALPEADQKAVKAGSAAADHDAAHSTTHKEAH